MYCGLQEEKRAIQQKVLNSALKDASEEERRRILEQFESDSLAVSNALREQKESQRDALLAKLAARKRMREELERERAVASELDRITKIQVGFTVH